MLYQRIASVIVLLTLATPIPSVAQQDHVPAASGAKTPAPVNAAPGTGSAQENEPVPGANGLTGSSAVTPSILVGAGTSVPVHVVGTVSSGTAKPSDTFQIQVAEDVVVDDMLVIRKGAGGEGHVVSSDSAGGNGHSGALALSFDYVNAVDGGRVRLSKAPQSQAEEDRKGASSTATIVGLATFGLGGLFGHNLAHGRQKTIDEKTIMSAFVADNVHVQSAEHANTARYDK